MSEKRITFRLNMDKFTHIKAYEIYQSIPKSQRSDFIRMAIILMNDRNEQINYMRDMLTNSNTMRINTSKDNNIEVSDNMIDFLIDFTE